MGRIKNFLHQSLRRMYRKLPVSDTMKFRCKNIYYSYFAFLTDEISYREWKKLSGNTAGFSEAATCGSQAQYLTDLFTRASEPSGEYVPLSKSHVELTPEDIKLIAFYLPQYHPIAENDLWWGRGFTEWTNVSKALPQFVGHYQPHLPGELGFYDLRLKEVQQRQIELAKQYGLYGFCYHHYWFGGKRLLERPVQQLLADPSLDMPFCLCWANENWTRRWDGMEQDVLMAQNYSPEDDLAFIADIAPALKDSRYIRIEGKALLVVYRVGLLPEPKETAKRWRTYCRENGLGELYLVAVQGLDFIAPEDCGFDAAVEFPPHTVRCANVTDRITAVNPKFEGIVYDFTSFIKSKLYLKKSKYKLFKGVFPSWDNTARKPNHGTVFWGAAPRLYQQWLSDVTTYTKMNHAPSEQLVFINAWNEWGEGAHLEPDRKYGYAYLQATANVIRESRRKNLHKKIIVASHDAHFNGAQMLALNIVRTLSKQFGYEVHLLLKNGGCLESEFAKYATVYYIAKDYDSPEKVASLVDSLSTFGAKIAICNTVITGDLVKVLKEHDVKVVSLIHELPGVIKQYAMEKNAAVLAEYADKVIFPAHYVQENFQTIATLEPEKALIRPQGLYKKNPFKECPAEARKTLREQLDLTSDSKMVVGVGYADHRKGLDLFAKVAEQAVKEDRNIHFLWVGDRDAALFDTVQRQLKTSGCDKNVHFIDATNDVALYYAGADLYLLTSREDPFPSVVMEAFDVGVPVIGFENAGGFSDIVTEKTGRLVPYLDTDAMSEAVISLLSDGRILQELGDAGRKLIDEQFQFSAYLYDLLSLLGHEYKKVSVVVPNYNYAQYLQERLASIEGQTYPIYELIVLDDRSSDNSINVIENFATKSFLPLKLYKNQENSGSVFRQWAKGVELATGDYIWIAEADDLALETFLEEAMQGFQEESVILSYTQSKQMDEQGRITAPNYLDYTNDIEYTKWKQNYVAAGGQEIATALVVKNTLPNVSAVVFKKVDMSAILEKLLSFQVAGDWFFYVWLLQKGDIAYCQEALNLHRRHSGSVTKNPNVQRHYDEIVQMQEYILSEFTVSEEIKKITLAYREKVRAYLLD